MLSWFYNSQETTPPSEIKSNLVEKAKEIALQPEIIIEEKPKEIQAPTFSDIYNICDNIQKNVNLMVALMNDQKNNEEKFSFDLKNEPYIQSSSSPYPTRIKPLNDFLSTILQCKDHNVKVYMTLGFLHYVDSVLDSFQFNTQFLNVIKNKMEKEDFRKEPVIRDIRIKLLERINLMLGSSNP
jgi:hypothetical protein